MNSLILLALGFVFVFIAYMTYGRYLARKLNLNNDNPTPSHTKQDGVDYVPSRPQILFGHHFASIAGAGPIVGPVLGAAFGWLPVYVWLIVGSIFMGAVHDFTSLVASIRHSGRSIGEVVEAHVGRTGKFLFLTFSWTTLIVICAAFMNICAQTFAEHPEAGASSIFFLVLAVFFGFAVYRRNFSMGLSTVIGVALLFFCVWLGILYPVHLSKSAWTYLLIAYISVASVTPVWILLQPRDYLNSFLLYALIIGAFIGVFVAHPTIQLSAFTGFKQPIGFLFPILFVTVACGAISGFHSLVSSGTTAKQLNRESDAKIIGYGSMLVETILAILAMITAAMLPREAYLSFLAPNGGGPILLFSQGIGTFLASLGIPIFIGVTFAALTVSAFALTTLDTSARLARYSFQEFFTTSGQESDSIFANNRYISTFISVAIAGVLALSDSYLVLWPLFGASNQLLAALALLAVSVWLAHIQVQNWFVKYPMIFMFTVTVSALVTVVYQNFIKGNFVQVGFGLFLLVVSGVLGVLAVKKMFELRMEHKHEASPAPVSGG